MTALRAMTTLKVIAILLCVPCLDNPKLPRPFYCRPVNGKGGRCHGDDYDARPTCCVQLKRSQQTRDGKKIAHQDHFMCTITCGLCGKRRHYADLCHIKKRESEKLKRQEHERQARAAGDTGAANHGKGAKGNPPPLPGGKGGRGPRNDQRRPLF